MNSTYNYDSVSLFYGNISLLYPRIDILNRNLGIMSYGSFNLQQALVSFIFYFGAATASLSLLRGIGRTLLLTKDYLASIFNGSKYISPKIKLQLAEEQQNERYFAVVYGLNRGGYIFAKNLAIKGFNLILIDRDMELLSRIEVQIRDEVAVNSTAFKVGDESENGEDKLIIHKLTLINFDQETLRSALIPVKDLPVKIFVNSKNSKRNADISTKNKLGNIVDFENENSSSPQKITKSEFNQQMGEELLTRNEVYFSGRENIEGFSTLLSIFLYQMRRDADYPSVINIDNYEPVVFNKIKRGQILFEASLAFQDTFTTMISKKFSDVKAINVKVNFKSLKDNRNLQKKLYNYSFSYLGIRDTLQIS